MLFGGCMLYSGRQTKTSMRCLLALAIAQDCIHCCDVFFVVGVTDFKHGGSEINVQTLKFNDQHEDSQNAFTTEAY